jgi:hypothetical protein
MGWRPGGGALLGAIALALTAASPAAATAPPGQTGQGWLPDTPSATWTYGWSDSTYSPATTFERYTVAQRASNGVELAWTTASAAGNGPGSVSSQGAVDFLYADTGIIVSNWASTPPPPQFPILCASTSSCGNSLASTAYLLIWGGRSPLLQEPLLPGSSWSSTGGQNNDVASQNTFADLERVVVPAFPAGVLAAKITSDITQAGAIGDPYGSGMRTVWWVYGVGPVKIVFQHSGGAISQAQLYGTSLLPQPIPAGGDYLPFHQGQVMRFSYRNNRYMPHPSQQTFTVGLVVNDSARVDVQARTGPIQVAGSYVFSWGLAGTTNLSVDTSAATNVHFPPLGPGNVPSAKRRRFFTPFDLMTFGFNPVLPTYPYKGQTWKSSKAGLDHSVFGVTGNSRVVGFERIGTPAGRFRTVHVRSKLVQHGFKFGSGVRDEWFAPGVGLVKLVVHHADGSVSSVERLP